MGKKPVPEFVLRKHKSIDPISRCNIHVLSELIFFFVLVKLQMFHVILKLLTTRWESIATDWFH